MTNDSEPAPEKLDFTQLNLRDDARDKQFLEQLKAAGVPVSNHLVATSIPDSYHVPTPEPIHDRLSFVVYEIAQMIDERMGALPTDEDGEVLSSYLDEVDFLEEILKKIVTAPLSAQYAAKLAFE